MENRTAILYASRFGQTAKIATFIADRLAKKGARPALINLSDPKNKRLMIDGQDFDSVLLGGPVYAGRYPAELRRFIRRNRAFLNQAKKCGFFSVSLAVSSGTPEAYSESLRPVRHLFKRTAWMPDWMTSLSGALNYREYNPLIRTLLRWISARSGGPTDIRHDHELTRWDEVSRFAEDFSRALPTAEFSTASLLRGERPRPLRRLRSRLASRSRKSA